MCSFHCAMSRSSQISVVLIPDLHTDLSMCILVICVGIDGTHENFEARGKILRHRCDDQR